VPELRWILLAAGVALIIGLWWWETRKAKANVSAPQPWRRERVEPDIDSDAGAEPEPEPAAEPASEPVAGFAPPVERVRAPHRPPVIEIPDDLEVDVSAYVGRDRRRAQEPALEPVVDPDSLRTTVVQDIVDIGSAEASDAPQALAQRDDHQHSPWVRTHPLDEQGATSVVEEEAPGPEPDGPPAALAEEAARQRIVALRLVAPAARWGGQLLRESLEAEGLHYGRYSIFHREREDGKTLFFVASLVEPGSFDLGRMDQQMFPGISLFGIVPGPLEAPATFDLILAAGRHLLDRLGGQLQDEQGSTLTAQRILHLREELVQFEHRHRRLRRY
jgi:cell division protein ZipA